jgi:hypothetical protein
MNGTINVRKMSTIMRKLRSGSFALIMERGFFVDKIETKRIGEKAVKTCRGICQENRTWVINI